MIFNYKSNEFKLWFLPPCFHEMHGYLEIHYDILIKKKSNSKINFSKSVLNDLKKQKEFKDVLKETILPEISYTYPYINFDEMFFIDRDFIDFEFKYENFQKVSFINYIYEYKSEDEIKNNFLCFLERFILYTKTISLK